ncbi:uncharacterized protein Klp61F [Epargyreus clarus]|uniref:uncharacterized protein Klp61F n=1 Tax=Epargyreus clarus TaxID=520877 RepID=UPI003C2B9E4A
MASEKGCRKDKNQNIQVFVRLRPLNQRERDIKSLGVVEVVNGREVVVRQSQQTSHTKRFTFDRAFHPTAKQVEVYQEVVSPLIEEVLNGYNCTVFAYGQTGTGKTHTMVGESSSSETTWQNDPLAGIIPRALSQLFDELRISNTEYTVRVSYLELYNEELFDLLSSSEDNSKLRIYEDVTRKGSNIVNGLEEITVYNKTEVYKIMAQGQERKRVASTLMNAQSSRSHTVFTIVVHMKENSPEGEELVKIGKLNLVDLAGSENISKAGSDNPAKRERARECVNINQSLLTLGRVITALVERHPHIPYRESKLTRILQESLGGRTKTSIIATISPGHKDLEETMSTLEYANRAKNIQNKPEVNQKMTKKAILKEYAEEIDRLKRDLQAARDKNGVYLANETFTEMTLKQEEQRKEIQELLLKKRAMEEERDRMEAVFGELNRQLQQRDEQLNSTVHKLSSTETKLANTSNMLKTTQLHYEETRYLVSKQQETEQQLAAQAKELLAAADAAATAASKLHDSVDKRKSIESTNLEITKTYRDIAAQHRDNITTGLDNYVSALTSSIGGIQTALESFTVNSTQSYAENKQILDQLAQAAMDMMNKMSALKAEAYNNISSQAQQQQSDIHTAMQSRSNSIEEALNKFSNCVVACLQRSGDIDVCADLAGFLDQWRTTVSSKLCTLRAAHEAFRQRMEGGIAQHALTAQRQCDVRRGHYAQHCADVREKIDSIIADKEDTDRRLAQQIEEVEAERTETERRLEEWIAEERRILEERIERHVTTERRLLEDKLRRRLENIESQRVLFEERTNKQLEWLNSLLRENENSTEVAAEDLKQNIKEAEDNLQDVNTFVVECERGSNAITSDVEALSENALKVVENVKTHLLNELQQSQCYVQEESQKLIMTNDESMKQVTDSTDRMIGAIVQNCQRTVDIVVNHVNENSTSSIHQLSSLSSTTSALAASASSHQNTQTQSLGAVQRDLEQLYAGVRQEVGRLAEIEGQCLNKEYAVYSPSGQTPVRCSYRYPRVLAATSPHERVLARYRALRQNSSDDDCIVVEAEGESRASDTDSSASDDSAVAFAAPSPPSGPTTLDKMPITKCTSETDIYVRRRQQEQSGKENANRSMSFKKPSKLPAPASHKKPLIERNDN